MVEQSHILMGTTATVLSVSEEVVWTGVTIAIVLLLFSAGVVLHVLLISRERKVSFGAAMSHAFSAIWALPVIAVVACFGFQAIDHFHSAGAQAIATDEAKSKDAAAEDGRGKPEFLTSAAPPSWQDDPGVISERGASVVLAEQKLFARVRRQFRQSATANDESLSFLTAWNPEPNLDQAIRENAVILSAVQKGEEKIRVSSLGKASKEISNT
ncbi:MAG: hypothetical protein IID45_01740, partial [Planctomycetes bacterium]|nr:hypothetical protein [Planctomycetota bacterium]